MLDLQSLKEDEKQMKNDLKWELASKALRAAADMADNRIVPPGENAKAWRRLENEKRRDSILQKVIWAVSILAVLVGGAAAVFTFAKEAKEEKQRAVQREKLDLYRRMSIRKGR